ncbi:MAG: efflux RND transporter periplasmic adaptor subunit [Mariniblastus sp.]
MDHSPNNTTAHHSTVELANCKIELRTDLSFHLQEYQGAPCYLIEDEINSRFFRVGMAEYHFISLMNGSTKIAQAIAQTAAQLGDQALNEQDAITIAKWLIDSGLATTDASRSSGRLMESFDESDRKKKMAKMNPVSPKFPLFNPDQLLTRLNAAVGWLFSFPLFVVWCAIVATAVYLVGTNWDSLTNSQSMIFTNDNWIWLGLTWIILKLLHETAHGIACKRYEGDVNQCGVVLIVMIPLPFVDVTSSWRFTSKWHRIYVAAAGMYVELFLAAIATIVWANTDGVIQQHAFNVMLAGSITTIFFNANPLMRFDGYYILSDWLELPNLGTHGQQWMSWYGKKTYLGMDVKQPSWPEKRTWMIATYAILALCWKVLICVGLALAAESLFFGAGVVLAAIAVMFWVVWPIGKLLKMVFIGEETQQRPSRLRFCVLTTALAVAGWAFLTYVPWYARIKAPAIVDYQESFEIRTPVGGFLSEIFVEPGQVVQAGHLLARLDNRNVDTDVEKLLIEIEANEVRTRQLRNDANMAGVDIELKNREALVEQLEERYQQQRNLNICAKSGGMVDADELRSLVGQYLAPGHMLCTIQTGGRKEVHAMISQHDFASFEKRIQQDVDVHVWGTGPGYFPAKMSHLNPRGRVDLPHPAFSATAGGALPVKYRAPDAQQSDNEGPLELVDPHFLARLQLSDADSDRLRSGQPATVSFRTVRGSVGDVLSEKISIWFRKMRKQAQAMKL